MLSTAISLIVDAFVATVASTALSYAAYQYGPLDRHNNAETERWAVWLSLAVMAAATLALFWAGSSWPTCVGVAVGCLTGGLMWLRFRDKLHR